MAKVLIIANTRINPLFEKGLKEFLGEHDYRLASNPDAVVEALKTYFDAIVIVSGSFQDNEPVLPFVIQRMNQRERDRSLFFGLQRKSVADYRGAGVRGAFLKPDQIDLLKKAFDELING